MLTKVRRGIGGKRGWETRRKNREEKERYKKMTPEDQKAYRLSKGYWF